MKSISRLISSTRPLAPGAPSVSNLLNTRYSFCNCASVLPPKPVSAFGAAAAGASGAADANIALTGAAAGGARVLTGARGISAPIPPPGAIPRMTPAGGVIGAVTTPGTRLVEITPGTGAIGSG